MSVYLPQIQGIRALAMLGIFICHTSVWLSDNLGCFSIVGKLGGSGVATFFILSGFLLAYKQKCIPLIEKRRIKAAWHKVNKLYPLYLITFIVAFIFTTDWMQSIFDWAKTIIAAIFNLSMTQAFVPFVGIVGSFNGPAWFLSALFGIWILMYWFPETINKLLSLSSKRCAIAVIFLLITQELWIAIVKYGISPLFTPKYLAWFYEWLVYYNPVICFSEYCVGVLLGRLCLQKQCSVSMRNIIGGTTMLVVILYIILLIYVKINVSVSKMVIAECFACFGIFAVLSPQTVGYKVLSNRVLVWFGNISGCFFLIHGAINYALLATIEKHIPKPWLFFVSLAISALLSSFAYYCFEKKRLTLLRKNENS